jgi:hypothetical protein
MSQQAVLMGAHTFGILVQEGLIIQFMSFVTVVSFSGGFQSFEMLTKNSFH